MGTRYENDVVAWAFEQAELLRRRNWSALDVDNLAEEIESVARTEQRALGSRMALLLAHLLKWQFQPARRSNSWLRTIRAQRQAIGRVVRKMPSLQGALADTEWLEDVWEDAVAMAARETGLDAFPPSCIWTLEQIFDPEFLPEAS